MIYTFELRKQGNRAPLIFVAHSDVYSDNYGFDINTTAQQRRQVLADFVRYLSQQDEARMVSNTQLVDWLNDPISLSGKVTNGVKPTTHSALVTQRDCNALPWQKNARYGSAQQVSYQGNRWYSIWTHENLEPGVDAVWLNLGRCGTQFQASNVIATTKRLELEPGSMWQGSNNTGTVAGFSEVLISINGEGIISPSQGNIYPIGSELPLEMVANEGHYLKNAWLDGEILITLDAIKLVNPKHELRLDFAQMPNNVCRSPKWENGNSYRSGERVNINNQEYQALYWNQSSPLSRDHTLWLEVGECLSH